VAGDGTLGAVAADRSTVPDELQGASDLSEDSVDGPPPASPQTSAGSSAGN
jgi:hypothetical protein